MENMVRQATQKSGLGKAESGQGTVYSPLQVNGQETSGYDNGQLLGSEKTNGTTPLQMGALQRQVSTGPNIVSEFNPINDELREQALDNP